MRIGRELREVLESVLLAYFPVEMPLAERQRQLAAYLGSAVFHEDLDNYRTAVFIDTPLPKDDLLKLAKGEK